MFTKFSSKRDVHAERISISQSRIVQQTRVSFVCLAIYQVALTAWEFQRLKIKRILSWNVVEPAQSKRAAANVFALKKAGLIRFCFGNKKRNILIQQNAHPIQRMIKFIDRLVETSLFSALEAYSKYLQIEKEAEDRYKTVLYLITATTVLRVCHVL